MNKSHSHIFNKHNLNPYSWVWITHDYRFYIIKKIIDNPNKTYYKNLSIYYRFKILTTPQI